MKRGRLKVRGRYALVLAAGQGTRMKSKKAKVLHPLCGKPLVTYVLDKLADLKIQRIFVVIGHEAEAVKRALRGYKVDFIGQQEQLGTGHAVQAAAPHLRTLSGSLLVLYGDTPLVTRGTLLRLLRIREEENADQVFLTGEFENPRGYGRIIRDGTGEVMDIVEEKHATTKQKAIREINPGFYCFKISSLLAGLSRLPHRNIAGEYYLTDMIRLLREQRKKVIAVRARSPEEVCGVNTREELADVESVLREKIVRKWMRAGVTVMEPSTVSIDDSVTIGADTTIYPNVLIEGKTRIGHHCLIRSFCHLKDAVLQEGVVIDHCSVVRESTVGRHTTVGPFAHLRKNSVIASNARIGNFVEVKESTIGQGTKAAHLSYLGDARIGREVNVGAGTITCNYDGVRKNQTRVEDHVFIGSNSELVAPVTIHKGAYVAAGSSITEDVPADSLALGRSRQVNKKGWARTTAEEQKKKARKGKRTSSRKS